MYNMVPDEDDDIMTVDKWIEACEDGSFIDYDGFGYPMKDGLADESTPFYPSDRRNLPKDATHIVWFNRWNMSISSIEAHKQFITIGVLEKLHKGDSIDDVELKIATEVLEYIVNFTSQLPNEYSFFKQNLRNDFYKLEEFLQSRKISKWNLK